MTAVIALLAAIHLQAASVRFEFKGLPQHVTAGYVTKPLAQCGSGAPVPLRGRVHFVIHFRPAYTDASFAKTRRLRGNATMQGLAKSCDFESDLAWAVGLDRRRPFHVSHGGSSVTVSFG